MLDQVNASPVQQPLPPSGLRNIVQDLEQMAEQHRQREASQHQALAQRLKVKNAMLLTWLSNSKSSQYSTIRIPKGTSSDGRPTFRVVYNPSPPMRFVQYKILKEILEPLFEIPDYIYAFEKDKSIPSMARVHEGALMIVSMDVKDFFPSIKQRQVENLLRSVDLSDVEAKTLSEIMTLGPNVPQGALTSPKLSNIMAATTFGPAIKQYCDERELQLTIYADDVTISSKVEFNSREVIDFVREKLNEAGFRVNHKKTKVMKKGTRRSRLYVCGTVVNEKVNLLKRERQRLRAIVHNTVKNGIEAEAAKNDLTPNEFVMRIRGKLNWFGQLNADGASRLIENFKAACTDWETMSQSTPYTYQ